MGSPLSFESALNDTVRSWLTHVALDASAKESIIQGLITDILRLRREEKSGHFTPNARAVAMNPTASLRTQERLEGSTNKPPKPPQSI
jgi:hypothetical protein